MRKRTRRILFISMVAILTLLTPWLILRSQGIRFDFQQKKFVKTGGIFVSVLNPKVEIYLDGKFKKTTNFISNSIFIKNLLPRCYKIELKKPGYFSWQKKLEVKEGLVTEAKDIILFKKNQRFEVLDKNIEDFLASEESYEFLVKKNKENVQQYLLINRLNGQKKMIFQTSSETEILDWDPINQQILLEKENKKGKKFFLIDYSNSQNSQVVDFSLPSEVKKITLHPLARKVVLFLRDNKIFKKDLTSKNLEENIFLTDVIWFKSKRNNLYWLNSSGFLIKSNWDLKKKEVLNDIPLSLKKERGFSLGILKGAIFLRNEQKLFRLNSQKEFEEIFDSLDGFTISPDLMKLAFWGKGEIWIFDEGKKFLTRFSQNPKNLFWINNHYLIFSSGEEIKIIETDIRNDLNIFTLKQAKNPTIFYSRINKKLYLLSDSTLLFSSEKLVP